ncbi:K02A2.6-like [Cordylochernes scorpioides]|uniref:RNA-directed DNA polymerase n=1 Tax=Cordylochernes scorpioides TaxID=51811 RepID=A0ABY6KY12_9ARAC|nr:K02A2.6-like [Cordylochernes scorpioides]
MKITVAYAIAEASQNTCNVVLPLIVVGTQWKTFDCFSCLGVLGSGLKEILKLSFWRHLWIPVNRAELTPECNPFSWFSPKLLELQLRSPVEVPIQTSLLNRHLAPTPRVIPARYNFFKSSQEDETISQFMATLRGLAEPCKFGSMLNEMPRDKSVVGVRSENLQKRLLQEGDDATLDKIYEIALSYEAAERDLLSMKKDHKAHLILRKDANPRFFRARNVPYVMRNAIEKELENLEAQGVITKIERSDCATPIVLIMKTNGHVRTLVYLDDIIITGESEADHLRNLEAVLNRLNEYGLKANRENCNFFQESLEYCGHVIDKMGLHKTNDKIRAVLDAPEPLNVTQLRVFFGLITYYHKFIRNAADVLSPLYALLKKGTKWHFSTECRKAFRQIKEIISSDQILIAYDPKSPIRLSCDSSSYGLGAVLSQIDVDGNERPIYFISRTLSRAEKKYSQIDKECLSIIWALKKFPNYLFGRKFELITDNKPLHHILNPKREISSNMSARLQRWALILSSYNFTIECRKTGDHGNADGLSRLPLKQYEEMEEDAVNTVHMIKQCEELPLTSRHIREELTVVQGILLLGTRVVIPRKFRAKIKTELHQGHLGVVKIKALARNFIWWPGIDREIEEITRVCRECNINNHTLKQESVHRWESAPTPWYRVHLDFAGPFMNKMFLIVIDSYSKWPEVIIMNSTTAGSTIRVLRDLFSRYGIPDQVVMDNGPQFVSKEMKYFLKSNGVYHLRSAPYFPATNGLAERFVQTLKRSLKNMRNEELNKSLAIFLFTYRTVPHSSTREAPAVLFLKRMLKSRWNLLKPKLEVKPGFKKGYSPDFEEDENILVRDFQGPNKWKEGKIVSRLGKCFYTVKLNDGRLWRRPVCQLRKSYIAPSPASEIFPAGATEDGSVEIPVSPSKENIPSSLGISAPEEPGSAASASDQDRTPQRRYPMRDRRPPPRDLAFEDKILNLVYIWGYSGTLSQIWAKEILFHFGKVTLDHLAEWKPRSHLEMGHTTCSAREVASWIHEDETRVEDFKGLTV